MINLQHGAKNRRLRVGNPGTSSARSHRAFPLARSRRRRHAGPPSVGRGPQLLVRTFRSPKSVANSSFRDYRRRATEVQHVTQSAPNRQSSTTRQSTIPVGGGREFFSFDIFPLPTTSSAFFRRT